MKAKGKSVVVRVGAAVLPPVIAGAILVIFIVVVVLEGLGSIFSHLSTIVRHYIESIGHRNSQLLDSKAGPGS